jgi:hypothetical protein
MRRIKNIEETGLFGKNDNKISMGEFLKRHEPDLVELLQEEELREEYGE